MPFLHFRPFAQKLVCNIFSIFPKDGTNQLPKAGFDLIALKVGKVGKV